MSDLLSAAKGIKAVREVSGELLIPVSFLALWSQFGPVFTQDWGWSVGLVLLGCFLVGLLGALLVYEFLTYLSVRFKEYPVLPVICAALIGVGLLVTFQDHQIVHLVQLNPLAGVAFLLWGFALDEVPDRRSERHLRSDQKE